MPRLLKALAVLAFLCSIAGSTLGNLVDIKAKNTKINDHAIIFDGGVVALFNNGKVISQNATASLAESGNMAPDDIVFSGDIKGCLSGIEISGSWAKYTVKTGMLICKGQQASVKGNDGIIYANFFSLDKNRLFATAKGNVILENSRYIINSEEVVAYFEKASNNKTVLKRAVSNTKTIIRSKEKVYTANACEYEGDIIYLIGNVVIRDGKNCILADKAKLNTITGMYTVESKNNKINAILNNK